MPSKTIIHIIAKLTLIVSLHPDMTLQEYLSCVDLWSYPL